MTLNTQTQDYTSKQLAQEISNNGRVVAYFNNRRTTLVLSMDTVFVIKGLSQTDYLDIKRCVQQIPAVFIENELDTVGLANFITRYAEFAAEENLPF